MVPANIIVGYRSFMNKKQTENLSFFHVAFYAPGTKEKIDADRTLLNYFNWLCSFAFFGFQIKV
jgi:hypothetical protein